MSPLRVVLGVSDSHLGAFPHLANAERGAGLMSGRELQDSGVLARSIDASRIATLPKVPGVESVEPDRDVGVLGTSVA